MALTILFCSLLQRFVKDHPKASRLPLTSGGTASLFIPWTYFPGMKTTALPGPISNYPLEPLPTTELPSVRWGRVSCFGHGVPSGGEYRDRTGDLLLAKQALSQLS